MAEGDINLVDYDARLGDYTMSLNHVRETKRTQRQKKLKLLQEVVIDLGLGTIRSKQFAIAMLQVLDNLFFTPYPFFLARIVKCFKL